MDDLADIAEADSAHLDDLLKADQRGFGGVVRGREALVQDDRAFAAIIQNEIGEGAANIESDAPACGLFMIGYFRCEP